MAASWVDRRPVATINEHRDQSKKKSSGGEVKESRNPWNLLFNRANNCDPRIDTTASRSPGRRFPCFSFATSRKLGRGKRDTEYRAVSSDNEQCLLGAPQ